MENHEDFCRKCREELGETPSTLLDPARYLGWSLGRVITNSSVRFCGRPILPPLLGLEQKAEMRELLATALEKSTRKIGASAQKHHAHTTTSSNNPQARDRAANDSRIDSSIERERRDEGGSCRGDDDDDGGRHHHQHRSSSRSDVSRHHAVSPASSFDLTRTVSTSSRHHPLWLHLDDDDDDDGDDDDDDGDGDDEEEEENSSTAVVTVGSPHDELGALGVPRSDLDADRFRTAGEKSAMQGDDVAGGGGGGDGGDGCDGDGCRPPGEPSAGVYTEMAARSDSPSLSVAELVVDDGSGGVSGVSGGIGVIGSGGVSGGSGVIGSGSGGGSGVTGSGSSGVIGSGVSGGIDVIGSGGGGGSGGSGVTGSGGSGVIGSGVSGGIDVIGSGGGVMCSGVSGGIDVIGSGGGGVSGGSGVMCSGVSGGIDVIGSGGGVIGSGVSGGIDVIGSGGGVIGSGVSGGIDVIGSGGGVMCSGVSGGIDVIGSGGGGVSGGSGVMCSGVSGGIDVIGSGGGVIGSGVSGGIDVIGSGGGGGVISAAGGNIIDGGSDGDRVGGVGGDGGSGGGSGGGFLPASASAALLAEGAREPACGSDDGGADEWSEVARLLEAQALMLMERTSPLGQGGGGVGGERRAEITSGGGGRWGGIGRLMGEGIYWGEGQMVGEERRRGEVAEGTSGGEAEGRALERMLEMRREGTSVAFEGTFGLGEGLRGLEVHGGRNRDAGIVDRRREEAGRSGGSQGDRRTRSEGGGFGGGGSADGMFAECLGVVAGRPSLPSAFPPCAWLSERSFERSPRARDGGAAPRSGVEAAAARADSETNRAARAAPLNRSYDVATPSPALLASLRGGGGEVERELVKRCLEMELCGVMGVRAKVTCGSYWRAVKDDSRLKGERVTALARGFLTRRLLATEKVQQLKQTVKDTRDLLHSLRQATPPRRSRSTQDSALYERALAQLRAALYDVHDIFFATTSHEKVEMMRSDREARREREQRRLERSVEVPHGRPVLSAATQKSLERKFKQRATEQNRGSPRTRGPIVRASSHSRVFRPNQSINTLPPAAMATGGLYRSAIAKGKETAFPASAASPTASRCARVRKIGGSGGGGSGSGGARKVGSIAIKKRPSLAM
ncbi:fibroin heavy chain-like isoform X2 [Lethenteron reissneri]|uniref:fibroin heavy chain-like isoform X2 n=1 Tax=Lethenteron reissneri TaxID=7753 RepID=UPI002AB70764|nr:fibroin heavy chain-like isoform X2 [Lethenteron reissneri]